MAVTNLNSLVLNTGCVVVNDVLAGTMGQVVVAAGGQPTYPILTQHSSPDLARDDSRFHEEHASFGSFLGERTGQSEGRTSVSATWRTRCAPGFLLSRGTGSTQGTGRTIASKTSGFLQMAMAGRPNQAMSGKAGKTGKQPAAGWRTAWPTALRLASLPRGRGRVS